MSPQKSEQKETSEFRSRFFEAVGRVGRLPEERFNWLANFARQEIPAVHAGEEGDGLDWSAKRFEIVAFAATGWLQAPAEPTPIGRLAKRRRGERGLSLLGGQPQVAVDSFHYRLVKALRSLGANRRCSLPFTVAEAVWTDDGIMLPVPAADLDIATEDLWSWFAGAVFNLLAQLAKRLKVCKNSSCSWLFLPSRRQEYCSRQCSQRVRTDRFRERHPEQVSEIQRRAYRRKRQGKRPGQLRSSRRPRRKA